MRPRAGRAPAFWQEPPGVRAAALAPLAALYATATARRVARPGARVPVPVIALGNLTAGGAGKTPAALALLARLEGRGAHALTRGHGGRARGPLRVDPMRHGAAEVGDEALLLAALAPTWISRDRAAGARAAAASGAGAIVMDDGFQNPGLAKDLSIVVVDAVAGFGNGRVIPAGPLREPIEAGLARADMLLVIGTPAARAAFLRTRAWPLPILEGRLAPREDWRGRRVLAAAGIGRPEKFAETLREAGAEVAGLVPLADHQPIPPALLAKLEARAAALGAALALTEKDAARLPPEARARVAALPVTLELEDWGPLDAALARLGL